MLRAPDGDDPESLADWMEACLLVGRQGTRLSDADLQDSLEEAAKDGEQGLESIIQQFHQRAQMIGDRYPIERVGAGFRSRGPWQNHLCYSFLLFTSLNQSYADLTFRVAAGEPAVLFEQLTAKALERFINGVAVRLGAPREAPVPGAFPAALRHLAQTIHEQVRGDGGLEQQNSGDDGLDVWVTRPFSDGRPSSVFLVAQCAIGTDWDEKRSSLDLDLWHRHIDWYTRPIKVFAVPFHMSQASWRETATRGGLVVDRPRLVQTIDTVDLAPRTRTRIRTWTRARVQLTKERIAA